MQTQDKQEFREYFLREAKALNMPEEQKIIYLQRCGYSLLEIFDTAMEF